MNLQSNPHKLSVTEYIVIPIDPRFDLSAKLTFAHPLMSIFGSTLSIKQQLWEI